MGAGKTSGMGRLLGGLALQSAARPKTMLVIIALLTVGMGAGMLRLETEANLLDIMPRGNEHTEAAQNASEEFRGFYDFVTVFYQIDEGKCERVSAARLPYRLSPAQCGNVTDEVYVRGMEDVWQFIQREIPAAEYDIDLAGIIKTVNWTNSGYFGNRPQDSALAPILEGDPQGVGRPVDAGFSMPGTDPMGELQYESAWRAAQAVDDSVNDVVAPTFKAGRTIIFFDTEEDDLSRVELGRQVYRMVDRYQAAVEACDDGDEATACELGWNVFSSEGLAVRGVASLDAHASDVTQRDISRLAPIVIGALVLILYLSFRDARVILVAAINLFVAFVWTAGLMGYLDIPFSALNLTIIPLILGVGIDYGIHTVSEYLDHKAQGQSDTEAFRQAGHLGGVAMLIATVTTVAGLLLMVLSPSLLMAQLAIVGSIALTDCFLFALTIIPALLTLTGRGSLQRRPEKGSAAILGLSSWVGRHRAFGGFLVAAFTLGSFVAVGALKVETFGNPELNYPKGDRVRDDLTVINEQFFGGATDTQSNYLIVEGDFTRPESHRFLDNLTENLRTHPDLEGFNTASLTRVVRAWVSIDQGTPDAIVSQVTGQVPAQPVKDAQYPQTQAEVKATLDAIFASPFANFMTILLAPVSYDIGMVSYDTHQGLEYKDARRVWTATEEAIEETYVETGYREVEVHQFGTNAVSYLFVKEQMPWVSRIGLASYLLITAMIAVMTRSWKATLATAVIMAVTSLWWLGTLPLLGVGLSVGLMLPLVFISAIGSDNALHLIWNLEHLSDQRRVYRFVGKAVLLTMATDAIAFAVFAFQTDLLVRKTMLATVSTSLVMWTATMLIVPLFYPPPREATFLRARPPRPAPLPVALATKRI
ncbi:MAG TPA: MMPL family transporter [Candidatus Thermoplasmatota archaeon]|nr:MMPL family transporter [Candidatus Thermoplasmatota archaeon]